MMSWGRVGCRSSPVAPTTGRVAEASDSTEERRQDHAGHPRQ
jgi:hypothetical protein